MEQERNRRIINRLRAWGEGFQWARGGAKRRGVFGAKEEKRTSKGKKALF